MPHVKPGDPLEISAAERNGWEDASVDFQRRILGGGPPNEAFFLPPGCVMLKNTSGGNLVQGRVLEIGSSLLTTFDRRFPKFNGSTPAPDGTKGIAVTLRAMVANDQWWCLSSGIIQAPVNIVHESHTHADVTNGSTLLRSGWYGRAEILSRQSSGTGEKTCWLRMGEMHRGPIEAVITEAGGIAMNDSGEVTIYRNGAIVSGATEDAHYIWLYNADLEEDQRITMDWYPDRQKFVIRTPWC